MSKLKLSNSERGWFQRIIRPLARGNLAKAHKEFLNVLAQARRQKLPKWDKFVLANTVDHGKGSVPTTETDTPIYVNSRYQVSVFDHPETQLGHVVCLCIKSNENDAYHDWRDFQRIKNELIGPEKEAIEIYPAESRLVDTANQYHLWVLMDGAVPLGFMERMVSESQTGLGRQRKWDPDSRPGDLKDITEEDLERVREKIDAQKAANEKEKLLFER